MAKYFTKEHSKFLIKIHVIFCVKYRKKLLVKYGGTMKNITTRPHFLTTTLMTNEPTANTFRTR